MGSLEQGSNYLGGAAVHRSASATPSCSLNPCAHPDQVLSVGFRSAHCPTGLTSTVPCALAVLVVWREVSCLVPRLGFRQVRSCSRQVRWPSARESRIQFTVIDLTETKYHVERWQSTKRQQVGPSTASLPANSGATNETTKSSPNMGVVGGGGILGCGLEECFSVDEHPEERLFGIIRKILGITEALSCMKMTCNRQRCDSL